MTGFSGTTASPGTTTTHTIDRKRLDLGLQIIDFVLEHSVLLQNLMRHIYGVIRMPIVPRQLMLPASESLFSTIRAEVPHNDDDAKLRTVIRIFQSSYQPIQATRLTTVDQVCRLITGENLRWEAIGNILAMASLCLIHIQARDFTLLDPDRRSKQDLVQPFHGITDTLTTLTSVSPVVNELGVSLKYNQLLLALYRFGDSSTFLSRPCTVPFYPRLSDILTPHLNRPTPLLNLYGTHIHHLRNGHAPGQSSERSPRCRVPGLHAPVATAMLHGRLLDGQDHRHHSRASAPDSPQLLRPGRSAGF
jgi:hypothetical protein